jgi:predicted RNA-binding Zn-ribbon protein involved in translation (DUF1610 family)
MDQEINGKCPECGCEKIRKDWSNRAFNKEYVSCAKCHAIYWFNTKILKDED